MKYFTRELWEALNSNPPDDSSDRQWVANMNAYWRQLLRRRSRLSASAWDFFTAHDVHDGAMEEFRVRDGLGDPKTPPVGVELLLVGGAGTRQWTVRYIGVRRVVFDYPTERPLFQSGGEGLGMLGYYELTSAGRGFLRHEILFDTGSTILIEFRQVRVVRASRKVGRAKSSGC